MNKLLSCEFNIDTGNVECRFADGTMISIDCDVVEDTIDGTLPFVRVRTELDWLIYNAPREYVQLVLNGGLNADLKNSKESSGISWKSIDILSLVSPAPKQ